MFHTPTTMNKNTKSLDLFYTCTLDKYVHAVL